MILCKEYHQEAKEITNTLSIDGLADPIACVYHAFAMGLKPPPPLDYSAWAQENIIFDADNQFPGPYDPDLFPFFKKVLKCLQPEHPARVVVLVGSAQCGKTICAEVFAGASLDKDPGGIFYVHPTLDNAATWVRTKWKKFVLGSKALSLIFPWELRSRETTNTLLHKERHDGRGFLKVAGANSASSLAMQTYRRQVHDDLGKWENNEHGDPEDQADKRSQAWGDWAKIFKISTPGIKGLCRITKNYERSNQQEYHVPCPHCGHKHALEWENFKKSLYEGMEYSKAHFYCPECGGIIEHHHKEWMLDQTINYDAWVAKNPAGKIEGFYIWSAYSRLVSWAYIAEEYFKAKGNPEKEQTFINDTVGLAYEQTGEAPPWKEIWDRAQTSDYTAGTIPPDALLLSIGCDVQGDRVEWLLKGFGSNMRRWTIQHGVIQGHISEQSTRDSLDRLLKRKWKNYAGRELEADILVIDANWETNEVKDWAKRWPENRVITIKGAREYTAPPMVPVQSERRNDGKKLKRLQKRHWLIGVSGLKASLYKNLEKTDPYERGYCGFPCDLDPEYYRQLCSETRVLEKNKRTNAAQYVWKVLPDVRNEILDMENYAEIGARRLSWTTAPDAEWERLKALREKPLENQQMELLEPNVLKDAAVTAPPVTAASEQKTVRKTRSKGIQ